MSAFTRYFLLLSAFGVLPAGAVLLQAARANAVVRENARGFHSQLARLAADSAEDAAGEMNRALAFAADLGAGTSSAASEAAALQRAAASDPRLLLAELRAADGRLEAGLGDPERFPAAEGREAWTDAARRAAAAGRVAFGAAREAGGTAYLPIAYPLPGGRLLLVAWGLEGLQRRLASLRVGGGRVAVADAAGRPLPGLGAGLAAGLPRPGGERGFRDDLPGGLVGAWARGPSLGWTVWSFQPRAEAYASEDAARQRALALFAALAALVAAGAAWLSGRIAAPLQGLAEGARRAAEGRFDAAVPESGWAEFREVQGAFNAMMRSLETYKEIKVDEQLREKAKLEAVVRAVPSGLVLADAAGRILFINSSARNILDRSSATMPARRTVAETLGDPRLLRLVAEAASGGRRLATAEVPMEVGGRRRVFWCQACPVESRGKLLGSVLILHDVTAEKDLEALRDRFLHSIVHDLRNPISAVKGWVDLMTMKGDLPESVTRGVEFMRLAVGNMMDLVENILESGRLKAGGVKPCLERVPAGDLLEEVRSLLDLRAQALGVALRVEAPAGAAALCDRRLLGRALGNLAGNALKFTPSGGSVTLRAVPTAGGMEFSVADTGRGIPPDKLGTVFRPFEQVAPGDAAAGFGLGLSLVKEWVELHGGRIGVESAPGRGTRFAFLIPGAPR